MDVNSLLVWNTVWFHQIPQQIGHLWRRSSPKLPPLVFALKPPAVQSGSVVKLWFLQRYSPRHLQVISNLWCWNIFCGWHPLKKIHQPQVVSGKNLPFFLSFPTGIFMNPHQSAYFHRGTFHFTTTLSQNVHQSRTFRQRHRYFDTWCSCHPCSDILRTGEKLEIDRGRNPPVWIWKGVFQTLGSLGEALNLLMWFSICFQALQRRLDPFHPIYFIQVVDLRWFQYRILMHTTNENMFF